MEISLKNKVIVITGGTKGVGRAVAEEACKSGARVVISGRNSKDGKEVIDSIKEKYNGEAIFIKGCLKKIDNCKKLIDEAVNNYGEIDGLVNYAGITTRATITEIDENILDDVIDTNFKSSFYCSTHAIKSMMRSNGGSIVNVASTHAYGGAIDMSAYGCSKGAMVTLSKHIAKNYAKHQIRSNAIIMGWSATPSEIKLDKSWDLDIDALNENGKNIIPMGRLQVNEDFVPAILFLLSDLSSHLTDSELCINGGFWPEYG